MYLCLGIDGRIPIAVIQCIIAKTRVIVIYRNARNRLVRSALQYVTEL